MSDTATILSFPEGRELKDFPGPGILGAEAVDFFDEGSSVCQVGGEQKKNILDRIDQLRHLVEQDRISGMVLIAQDPITGYFLTDICLEPDLNRTELFGFVGVLETVKLEISEAATMAPVMDLTGTIVDPYFHEEDNDRL